MMPFDPAGAWGGVFAAVTGACAGWLLAWITGEWIAAVERDMAADTPRTVDALVHRRTDPLGAWVAVGFLLATLALWWWEVRLRAGLPSAAIGPVASAEVVAGRWLAHVVLLWFLFAATWIDLRFRVIPDWVTVTGLLVGLVAVWAWPTILLPVTTLVPREFAVPLEVPDVLGWAGPLFARRHPVPRATPGMLVAALGMFAAWWWIGTGPDGDAPGAEESRGGAGAVGPRIGEQITSPPSAPRRLPLRWAILVVGFVAIAAAWWWGGPRDAALFSSLTGMAVAGGLVWATRAGASAAMGREAMGMGDVTLMAMVGAWLGWQASVVGCFLGVLVGLVHGVALLVLGRGSELPFGPGLCVGTALTVLAWRAAWRATAASFSEPGRIAAVLAAVVAGTAVSLWVWGAMPERGRRALLVAALVFLGLLVAWVSAMMP